MFASGARGCLHVVAALASLLAVATLALVAPSAHAASAFARGFADDVWFTGAAPHWIPQTVATGAKRVLLEVDWPAVEPRAPAPGFDATSPSDAQYDFAYLDARVREFAGTGISVALLVSGAPAWAEAPGGPAGPEAAGAWRPNATAYGQLAAALAARYSGSYPDPLSRGHVLPRVRYFQAWAEANLYVHLAPQWTASGGKWVSTGPGLYRALLNAFYAGVKSVHSDDVVITSGFGPFGGPPGACAVAGAHNGCRMPPAQFVRELLCLHGPTLNPEGCPDPAHFDALAMDPYESNSPTTPAVNADDISAPDFGKLTRIIDKAEALGRALPRRHKQLWVTEFSYDSNPPNPYAVSLATQARWLEQSFYVFWHEGVDTLFWYLVRDQPGTDYNTTYFSGVYFLGGQRKPSFEAYRFPFVVMSSERSATAWGIAPRTGSVAVEHKQGRSWKVLFQVRASAGRVFVRRISARSHGSFRAVVGGESSLVWQR